MGTSELLGKRNKFYRSDLPWTSIPSRGSTNTPSRFMLPEGSSSYEPVCLQGFTCYHFDNSKHLASKVKIATFFTRRWGTLQSLGRYCAEAGRDITATALLKTTLIFVKQL